MEDTVLETAPLTPEEEAETPRHPVCQFLRTKKMFYAGDMLEAQEEILSSNTYQNFWCQHTQTDTGPDDFYVEHARCRPGRSCYRPLGGG